MSFNIGLSGLRGAQTDLSVTGNNIANASTTGFKQSRAEFGDVYNASILGTGRLTVGSGVLTERVSQQHTQGNVNYTDRALDMAINGNGYFILSNEGQREYTRAGYFDLDKDGFITNNTGKRLQGYEANLNGDIQSGALGDIQLTQTNIQPRATSGIEMELNLDSRSAVAGGASRTVYSFSFNETAPAAGDEFTATINGEDIDLEYDGTNWSITSGAITIDGEQYDPSISGNQITLTSQENGRFPDQAFDVELQNTTGTGVDDATDIDATDVAYTGGSSGNWEIANFDPRDRSTYTDANSTSIYDSLGNEHVLRQYYIKVDRDDVAGGNAWAVLTSINGSFFGPNVDPDARLTEDTWDPAGLGIDVEDLVQATKFFNTQGDLQGVRDHTGDAYTSPAQLAGNVRDASFTINIGDVDFSSVVAGAGFGTNPQGDPPDFTNEINFNFRGSTQYGARFAVQSQSQDGYTTGRLAGLEVDQEGIIFGRYTNGQNRPVGQVPLATFTNPEGLRPKGSTAWLETTESGIPAINQAGAGITGNIEGGALEESNVDLSEELVKMIIAQRNYQANAKTIQTQDTLTQTIINLR
ncbi:flagellar hook protein FlgE [Marinospirillum celere]|uniref:Flagellar hook protein FlgE n=1 Tax=Marinospirillum celere TaxID=1122252 RepID=A0A1I1HA70_9GAMM|nr:flagellar hook protein FlgE [Marinospirillum celere]SFC20864.1 flagellar hook protein FlgE [Marinospirillum celere]